LQPHAPGGGKDSAFQRAPESTASSVSMILPETLSKFEEIKKRSGYLWRFL
jgi:hypothetical protein